MYIAQQELCLSGVGSTETVVKLSPYVSGLVWPNLI